MRTVQHWPEDTTLWRGLHINFFPATSRPASYVLNFTIARLSRRLLAGNGSPNRTELSG